MAKKATTEPDAIPVPELELRYKLAEPFGLAEVHWYVSAENGTRAAMRPHVSVVSVAERLDDAVGISRWQDSYDVVGQAVVCTLRVGIDAEWVSKSDCAPIGTGGVDVAFADAFKRSAAKFGVGRYLTLVPAQWVEWDAKNKCAKVAPVMPKRFLSKRDADKAEAVQAPESPLAETGVNGQKVAPVQLAENKPAPAPEAAKASADHSEMWAALSKDDKAVAKPAADIIVQSSGPEGSRAMLLQTRKFYKAKAMPAPVLEFLETLLLASWDGTPGSEVLQ